MRYCSEPIGFLDKPAEAGAEHVVEAFLLHEAGAKHDPHIGPQTAKTLESFFTIHEWHAEIEQD